MQPITSNNFGPSTSDKGSLIVADYGSDGSEGTSSVRDRDYSADSTDCRLAVLKISITRKSPRITKFVRKGNGNREGGERGEAKGRTRRVRVRNDGQSLERPRNEDKIEKLQSSA